MKRTEPDSSTISWAARLRPLRYRLRCMLLCASPTVYWSIRRLFKGFKEPEMSLVPLLCDPARTSLDIGANFGAYTFFMARHSRTCHAFEPLPLLARTLRTGYRGGNVVVHQVAVSDREGRARIRMPRADIGFSTIEPSNILERKTRMSRIDEFEVTTFPLDGGDLGDVAFVKMDVEGHEVAVLRGGRLFFDACRPSILMEVEDRHCPGSLQSVLDFLLPLNYGAYTLGENTLLPCPTPDEMGRTSQSNILFLQQDVAHDLSRALSRQPAREDTGEGNPWPQQGLARRR